MSEINAAEIEEQVQLDQYGKNAWNSVVKEIGVDTARELVEMTVSAYQNRTAKEANEIITARLQHLQQFQGRNKVRRMRQAIWCLLSTLRSVCDEAVKQTASASCE